MLVGAREPGIRRRGGAGEGAGGGGAQLPPFLSSPAYSLIDVSHRVLLRLTLQADRQAADRQTDSRQTGSGKAAG